MIICIALKFLFIKPQFLTCISVSIISEHSTCNASMYNPPFCWLFANFLRIKPSHFTFNPTRRAEWAILRHTFTAFPCSLHDLFLKHDEVCTRQWWQLQTEKVHQLASRPILGGHFCSDCHSLEAMIHSIKYICTTSKKLYAFIFISTSNYQMQSTLDAHPENQYGHPNHLHGWPIKIFASIDSILVMFSGHQYWNS